LISTATSKNSSKIVFKLVEAALTGYVPASCPKRGDVLVLADRLRTIVHHSTSKTDMVESRWIVRMLADKVCLKTYCVRGVSDTQSVVRVDIPELVIAFIHNRLARYPT
jgi:hypothetical protein